MNNILFVNHGISRNCGVYTQGLRHFNSLSKSKTFNFIYEEIDSYEKLQEVSNKVKPVCILYNYMPIVLPWISENIKNIPAKHICIIHNITQDLVNTGNYRYGNIFDSYVTLDISLIVDEVNIFKTNRPVYEVDVSKEVKINTPVKIGTFGFPFIHKGFHKIVQLVNSELEVADINLHMTDSYFCSNETDSILSMARSAITKRGIRLNYTNNYLSEIDMVKYLSKNDINVLLYDNIPSAGVSAAIDYLISSQKPILISESQQFRNYHDRLPVFPKTSIRGVLNNYRAELKTIKCIYNDCINISRDTDAIIKKIINYVQ